VCVFVCMLESIPTSPPLNGDAFSVNVCVPAVTAVC